MSGMFALKAKDRARENRMKELRETFDKYDTDGDGQLSPDDWLQLLRDNGHNVTR